MNMNQETETRPLMVSIRCITYNHEPYIRQCLDGFVMQKTNFRFEAIVHDDASTDGTADIIREYAEKYPDIIKPIFESENQYSKHDGSLSRIMDEACTGKYIAICEGDDYWTDPNKLQIQVDFMENHSDYSMCWHDAARISAIDGLLKGDFRRYKKNKTCKISDLISGGGDFCPTASFLYVKELKDKAPKELFEQYVGDYPLQLYMSFCGKVFYFDKIMSVYRVETPSSWSSKLRKKVNVESEIMKQWDGEKKIYDDFNRFSNYKYNRIFKQLEYVFLFGYFWRFRKFQTARKFWYKIDWIKRPYNFRVLLYIHGYETLRNRFVIDKKLNIYQNAILRFRSLYGKIFPPRIINYNSNCLTDRDQIQQIVLNKIISGCPLMVARMGRTEIDVCENIKYTFFEHRNNWKFIQWKGQPNFLNPWLIPNFNKLSGFFPYDDEDALKKFYLLMLDCMHEVDILGSWCSNEALFDKEWPQAMKVSREEMTPLLTNNPWTKALKGKNVLIVHPFADSIKKQIEVGGEKLFPQCPEILPNANYTVIKAVQTLGCSSEQFKDWFEALTHMEDEIDSYDYDICLIGCGAYGFPLAAHCKRKGKQAIHLGGSLQLLFGIIGRRWETDPGYINDFPYLSTYQNENWIRPSEEETPKKSKEVEDNCYW